MNTGSVKTEFDDQKFELNYNDYKDRFPKIIDFYTLVHVYKETPNYFVQTTEGAQVYPGVRYKQNDVATDWKGSWHHIPEAFQGVDQTMREIYAYLDQKLKSGEITLTDPLLYKPDPNTYYTTGNTYGDFYNNVVFPWRNYGNRFTNQTMEYLLDLEPVIMFAMSEFARLNNQNFEDIKKARVKRDLLAKQVGSLTGEELFQVLDYYMKDRGLDLTSKS